MYVDMLLTHILFDRGTRNAAFESKRQWPYLVGEMRVLTETEVTRM
jgi:hypothetical protein